MVINKELQKAANRLLQDKDVSYIIGYKKGPYGLQIQPYFLTRHNTIDNLIFSPLCTFNLTVYLKYVTGNEKVGILVKGCDSRAIIQLLQEHRINRDNIKIIGIPCKGVIDSQKIQERFSDVTTIVNIEEDSRYFKVIQADSVQKIPREDILQDRCLHCEYPTPLIYDILLKDPIVAKAQEKYTDVRDFEKKSLDKKWSFWEKNFQRCIRCYACRNICPFCYCTECIAEKLDPKWLRRSVNSSENTAWNIIRAYHLAGRCIGCGECERVCPVNIPLQLLNKKIEKDIQELFQYRPGISLDEKPLLGIFKPEELDEYLL